MSEVIMTNRSRKTNVSVLLVTICGEAIASSTAAVAVPSKAADQRAHESMMKPKDDASYVEMMAMHHQHGIEMAKMAVEKAQRNDVKDFARRTIEGQQKDLDELKKLQQTLKSDSGKGMHPSMMESESKRMMDKLQATTGDGFDTTFIDLMVSHHQEAIDMSSPVTRFKSAEVQTLARKTIEMQRNEIRELQRLRGKK